MSSKSRFVVEGHQVGVFGTLWAHFQPIRKQPLQLNRHVIQLQVLPKHRSSAPGEIPLPIRSIVNPVGGRRDLNGFYIELKGPTLRSFVTKVPSISLVLCVLDAFLLGSKPGNCCVSNFRTICPTGLVRISLLHLAWKRS